MLPLCNSPPMLSVCRNSGGRLAVILALTQRLSLALAASLMMLTTVASADAEIESPRTLPAFKFTGPRGDYYPLAARVKDIQGPVLIAFSIDKEGRAIKPSELYSSDPELLRFALRFLGGLRFDLPADWTERNDLWKRWRIRFDFVLGDCAAPRSRAGDETDVAHHTITLCAPPILRPTT